MLLSCTWDPGLLDHAMQRLIGMDMAQIRSSFLTIDCLRYVLFFQLLWCL